MAEPNFFQNLAEAFDTTGRFARTRIAEEELERRRESDAASQEQGQAQALGRKLKIYQGLLQGVEDSTRAGETAPEELESFRQRLSPVIQQLQEQMGVPVGPMPPTDIQPDAPEPINELDRLFQLNKKVQKELEGAQSSGDPTLVEEAQNRLEAVQNKINLISSRAKQMQVIEARGRKQIWDLAHPEGAKMVEDLGPIVQKGTGKEATYNVFQAAEGGGQEHLGMFSESELQQFRGKPGFTAYKLGTKGGGGLAIEMENGLVKSIATGSRVDPLRGGVQSPIGAITPLFKQLNSLEGSLIQLMKLDQVVRPEDTGLNAVIQEEVWNRGVAVFAQLAGLPTKDLIDQDFVENRLLMKQVSERLLKVMQDLPDRFSNVDREKVEDMLLKGRPRVTFDEYKAKLAATITYLQDKRLLMSNQLQRRTVLDMSLQEIREAAAKEPGDAGYLDPELAARVMAARQFSDEELGIK